MLAFKMVQFFVIFFNLNILQTREDMIGIDF